MRQYKIFFKTPQISLNLIKQYGPKVLRIVLFVYCISESTLADEIPASSPPCKGPAAPASAPQTLNLLPAATSPPAAAIGIAACILAGINKAVGKLFVYYI